MNNDSNNFFHISKKEIIKIFENYVSGDSLKFIESHNGSLGLCRKLNVDPNVGIKDDIRDIESRRNYFGTNFKKKEIMPSFFFYVKEVLGDTFLRILIIAAIFQIAIGASPLSENPQKDWIDGVAILFAVIVVVLTSSITNYNKEKKFKQISSLNSIRTYLLKRNIITSFEEEQIVVGDILNISTGTIVPCDGLLLNGNGITVDESSITGESRSVEKQEYQTCLDRRNKGDTKIPSPLLLAGSLIKAGDGWMIVMAVGSNSTIGRVNDLIKSSNQTDVSKTPLETKLENIAEDIGKFGLISAVLTFIALIIKLFRAKYEEYNFHTLELQYLINNGTLGKNKTEILNNRINGTEYEHIINPDNIWNGIYKDILSIIILCIAIIVVAIPEGLPLAVTLALSYSVNKMMNDNNLVRRMHACETMGGANYICTDKTGTLTQNNMKIVNIYNNQDNIDTSLLSASNKMPPSLKFNNEYYNIMRSCLINNIDIKIDQASNTSIGSRTDMAFYDLLLGFGENVDELMKISRIDFFNRINFTSERKRMSTITKITENRYRVFTKGTPNLIIEKCSHFIDKNCKLNELKDIDKIRIKDVVKGYEGDGLRCLSFAYKDVVASEAKNFNNLNSNGDYNIEELGFYLVGTVSMRDSLKPGVEQAVAMCKNAGINVIMMTGDSLEIAISLSKSANIISRHEDYKAMTGIEFMNEIGGIVCVSCSNDVNSCPCPITAKDAERMGLDSTQRRKERIKNFNRFKEIAKNLKVIASSRPVDKYALVLGLKQMDHVVGVTGDGVNDAPALSKSDVGLAMGRAGTDVAKNSADIIILDDDFSSIVKAVIWGRNIYDNIRKFIQFQLSVNLSAVLLVFVSSCVGSESPISAIQMLWINLIMDSLGSLSLATDQPTDELLNRKPHSRREYIISSKMWKHIFIQSIVQFTLVFLLYIYAPYYILEKDMNRIATTQQIENCFGDFPGEIIKYKHHVTNYYILDGRKSRWSALRLIQKGLDPSYCMFYNYDKFKPRQIKNLYDAFKWINIEYGNTVHMTIIFNSFVIYTLFNQINSRILDDSFNIFKNIHRNCIFVCVLLLEFSVQFIIVQYGGLIFKCTIGGLTDEQWGICIILGSISLLTSILLKIIKIDALFEINIMRLFRKKNNNELEQNLFDERHDEIDSSITKLELKNI